MKIRNLASVTLPLCLAITASAQWQKFDDFEGGNLNKWVFTQSDVGTTADSSVAIVADPDAAGAAKGNKVMLMSPGSPFASDHRSRMIGRVPPINYGTTGTLFFRWYTKTVTINGTTFAPEIDMVVGMSAVDIPTQYNEYGPLSGFDVGEQQYRAYNGDPNPETPASVIGFQNIMANNRPNNVWVSQWFYVRNLDVANQRQDYQIYNRVGASGTPVLVYPFVAGEFAGFRAKPDGDLDKAAAHLDVFAFTNSAGTIAVPQALDAAYFADDVYVDQNGINLSDPTGATSTPAPAATRLTNIATRGEVLTGAKILIGGFTITGTTPQQVLIRAVGPTLGALGVPGSLATPVLTLFQGTTQINTNTGWGTATNAASIPAAAASVGAFALPAGSADSCLLVTLAPGGYTAQVTGVGTATGVALVEVYSVSP